MKIFKKIVITILILGIFTAVFREWIYQNIFSYESIGERPTYALINPELAGHIDNSISKENPGNIQDIIEQSLDITSDQLNFTASKNDNDPNKLIDSKTAHCVGYANFFTTTCNYLLQKNDLADTWKVKTEIGQLYLLGVNIHSYLNSPFLRDHDFVSIENKETGEVLAVDPSVHDYLRISLISYQK